MCYATAATFLRPPGRIGAPPYSTAEVAWAWGAENQRQTSPHRDSLIQKGLIWSPRRGQVDFTVLNQHHQERVAVQMAEPSTR